MANTLKCKFFLSRITQNHAEKHEHIEHIIGCIIFRQLFWCVIHRYYSLRCLVSPIFLLIDQFLCRFSTYWPTNKFWTLEVNKIVLFLFFCFFTTARLLSGIASSVSPWCVLLGAGYFQQWRFDSPSVVFPRTTLIQVLLKVNSNNWRQRCSTKLWCSWHQQTFIPACVFVENGRWVDFFEQ